MTAAYSTAVPNMFSLNFIQIGALEAIRVKILVKGQPEHLESIKVPQLRPFQVHDPTAECNMEAFLCSFAWDEILAPPCFGAP